MFNTITNVLRLIPIKSIASTKVSLQSGIQSRNLHITSVSSQKNVIRSLRDFRPKFKKPNEERFDVVEGAADVEKNFPNKATFDTKFDGVPFKYLPVINVKACKNNTIINVTDYKGTPLLIKSCGTEGYKTAKKATNVAAQATGYAISRAAFQQGIVTVRVRVQGLGPGRLSAIKGLETGGTKVVSITDTTPVSWCPPRPRKRRRV